jgi:hypothetical protein
MTVATLPRVIAVLSISDYGEFGAAYCPHCDAKGRYIQRLLTEDGVRGAMAGCAKLFPPSPLSKITDGHFRRIKEIRDQNKGQSSWVEPRKLASWDEAIAGALHDFEAKEIDLREMEGAILDAERQRKQWLDRRYGKRGRR